MRLLRMGTPLAIFGLISTFMLNRAGEIESPNIGFLTFTIIWLASVIAYSYQNLTGVKHYDDGDYRGSLGRATLLIP